MNIIQELFEQVGKVDHEIKILEDRREEIYRRIDREYEKLEMSQKSIFEVENVSDGQYEAV